VERIYVQGGRKLRGEVRLSGSKNASLPILAATLLAEDTCVIHNVPRIEDTRTMIEVLRALGAKVKFTDSGTVTVNASRLITHVAPYELVKRMRASFYVAGPLLARLHKAEVPLPGGCILGTRPVNFHTDAFQKLGARVLLAHGFMRAECRQLTGALIYLDPRWCSVGTTMNIVMAAAAAQGRTVVENAARDPEVQDFIKFLRKMGACIQGAGSSSLTIDGVRKLSGCEHTVISDRIEAGTLLMSAAATGGDVTVYPLEPVWLDQVLEALSGAGANVTRADNAVRVQRSGRMRAVDIATAPFPGFPTDLHPPFVAMISLAEGRSVIDERIYESRFAYVDELRRMGTDINVLGQTAVVRGVQKLTGAPVEAPDIRAGAALITAALAAEGESEISNIVVIDRGYESIEQKLAALGASIVRHDSSGRQAQLCLA